MANIPIQEIAQVIRSNLKSYTRSKVTLMRFEEYERGFVLYRILRFTSCRLVINKINVVVRWIDGYEFLVYLKFGRDWNAFRLIFTKFGIEYENWGRVSKDVVMEVLKDEFKC